MKKLIHVDKTFNGMRIDRFLRNQFGQIPQSLIEKSLRLGKIKVNKKKVKSSYKIQLNDIIDLAKNDNQPAICITDNNNMFGALEFSEKFIACSNVSSVKSKFKIF